MATMTVLDETKVKIKAIESGMSLRQVNDEAGLGINYIYRCFGSNKITLATVDAIASALKCSTFDLLTEVEVETDTQPVAPVGITETRTKQRELVLAA